MSQSLINRSPDLKQLRDEGYDVDIQSNYLVVRGIPYVNSKREISSGVLVSELTLSGDTTTKPGTHVAMFSGEHPCDMNGSEITQIKHNSNHQDLSGGLSVDHSFSCKPNSGKYKDYYEKMTTYTNIISGPAQAINPAVTAKTFKVIASGSEVITPFQYLDTSTSRAGINVVNKKLEIGKIGIVGLGGTGSYVLDLVAKTPVAELHLFDGDKFMQHNAFRSPGAASLGDLDKQYFKVDYFYGIYFNMHKNIVPHHFYVDSSNVDLLNDMDFVFLCLDEGSSKRLMVTKLEENGIPFIDVGMGIELTDGRLNGHLRITTSTFEHHDHIEKRILFSDVDGNDDYAQNIQIADLNSLNASLAVIRWKKLCGFYRDLESEHNSIYTIDGNWLINEDRP